ncbi:MAG: c-type cytochrome, partial [Myxococcales bacterium]|nr:c-type cytochrome [Myxococcales bacterium]
MSKKEYVADRVLGHSDEADGIEEYDNKLPTWWVGLFFATIIGAIWMLLDWHVLNDKTLDELYQEELAAAEERYGASVVEADLNIVLDDAHISSGAALFATNCVPCHGEDATGGIGPNLTDSEWLYGGTPEEIGHTVFYGTSNGMLAWGQILRNEGVSDVTAYVHSLGGGQPRPGDEPDETPAPELDGTGSQAAVDGASAGSGEGVVPEGTGSA